MATRLNTELLNLLDIIAFEVSPKNELILSCSPPDWLLALDALTTNHPDLLILDAQELPFLENFLIDAHEFWTSDTQSKQRIRSGFWVEVTPDGKEIPLEAYAIKLGTQKILTIKYLGESYENYRKQLQIARNELLEKEQVNLLAEKYLSEKVRAEQESLAKSLFISNMNHELRTPMNSILGFSQILEMSDLDETQKRYVENIHSSANHLLNLINNILDLAKIESGKSDINIEDINISDVIEQCFVISYPLTKPLNIELKLKIEKSCPILIKTDFTRIKQILLNLISNAIKYNQKNGSVTVHLSQMSENDHSFLKVEIIDTGKGIPLEFQKNLFEPFNRLQHEGSDIQGSGIGLSLIKSLIEQLCGQLHFISEPNKGTNFWFYLPLNLQSSATTDQNNLSNKNTKNSSSEAEPLLSTKTILYVEDNKTNISLVQAIFKNALKDTTLIIAEDGLQGIKLAEEKIPDLILLDIVLPDIDGYEVFARIKNITNCKDIPIIALSANTMLHDQQKMEETGFTDFIPKPIQIPQFLETIKRILSES